MATDLKWARGSARVQIFILGVRECRDTYPIADPNCGLCLPDADSTINSQLLKCGSQRQDLALGVSGEGVHFFTRSVHGVVLDVAQVLRMRLATSERQLVELERGTERCGSHKIMNKAVGVVTVGKHVCLGIRILGSELRPIAKVSSPESCSPLGSRVLSPKQVWIQTV